MNISFSNILYEVTNPNILYHGTHIKNLKEIEIHGLLPDFGSTVKSTEAWQYYEDEDYYPEDYKVEGILFFSDNPNVWSYSHFGGTPNVDEAVLILVENNKTIYHKIGDYVYDYNGNKNEAPDGIPTDKLPPFIEDGDFFTFKEQEPYKILYGNDLKTFLKI